MSVQATAARLFGTDDPCALWTQFRTTLTHNVSDDEESEKRYAAALYLEQKDFEAYAPLLPNPLQRQKKEPPAAAGLDT